MTKYEFILTGRTSLLMHADDVEASDELKAWRQASENKNITVPGDDRSPAWTWQTYCYSDGENLSIPSENLMVALRQAGAQIILKRQKTFKELTQSGMTPESEFLTFTVNGKPVPMAALADMRGDSNFKAQANACRDMGFRLFVKRAKVGQSKHVRVRPRFDTWEARGRMLVTAPELTPEVMQRIFELVGNIGLGDWRPGCKTPGCFGQFEAKVKKV